MDLFRRTYRLGTGFAAACGLLLGLLAAAPAATAQPILVDPDNINFGEVVVGNQRDQVVEITDNNTGQTHIIEDVVVNGPPDFQVFANLPIIVTPSQPGQFTVRFEPLGNGPQEGSVEVFIENEPDPVVIPVQGVGVPPPAPDIAVSRQAINFGPVDQGDNAAQTFDITNLGNAPLNGNLAVIGPNANAFAISQTTVNLGPGAGATITVTFSPPAGGLFQATVRITSNDPDEPTVDVALAGTGVLPPVERDIDFGPVRLFETDIIEAIVENVGGTVLNLVLIEQGDATGSFSASPLAFTLQPGQRQTVRLRFSPQVRGLLQARVLVDNATTVPAKATGQLGIFNLMGEGVASRLVVESNEVDFGEVPVGDDRRLTVTVRNDGTASLNIQAPVIEGGGGQFVIAGDGGARTIQPGNTHTISVAFRPDAAGLQTASLVILGDDPDNPEETVALFGVGTCAIVVAPLAIDFGDVLVATTASETVTLFHRCGGPLEATLSLEGAPAFAATPSGPLTLPSDTDVPVTVTFTAVEGPQVATLHVDTDDTDPPRRSVALQGRGVRPRLNVPPNERNLNFGIVTLGRTGVVTATLINDGDAPLVVSGITLGAGDAGEFAVLDPGPFTLPPEASQVVRFEFTPTSPGEKTVGYFIDSSDPDRPRVMGSLTGVAAEIRPIPPVFLPDGGVQVVFDVPDDLAQGTATLSYRQGGEQAYQSVPLTPGGAGKTTSDAQARVLFQGTIPGAEVGIRGLQYFATFTLGNTTLTLPRNADGAPFSLQVPIGTAAPPYQLPADGETYRMVSYPLLLEDFRIAEQLIDDFGPYDPNEWRALKYVAARNAYTEFPNFEGSFGPGFAFWLITREATAFDVEDGLSVDLSQDFRLVVPGGGFTQIATPFAFPVAWSSIRGRQALRGPYHYDGTEFEPGEAGVLEPWDGYFVYNPNSNPVELLISPVEATAGTDKTASAAPFLDASYTIQFAAVMADHGLRDSHTYVGFAPPGAAQRMDWPEPPGIGRHLSLRVVEQGRRLMSHFRPDAADGAVWDLELSVEGGSARGSVRVALYEHGLRPDGFSIQIIDRDDGRVLPAEGFGIELSAERPVRALRVVVGTDAFAGAQDLGPRRFVLDANYPNPFNPETVIGYSVGRAGGVTLAVYDVLGRRVRTLVAAEQPAGRYEAVWDGRDDAGRAVASGVYLYRLDAAGFTETRKMLLLR